MLKLERFDRILDWERKREDIEESLFGEVLNEDTAAKAAGFQTLDCLMDFYTAVESGASVGSAYSVHGCGRRLVNVRT